MATNYGPAVVGSQYGNMYLGWNLTNSGATSSTTSVTWTLSIYFKTEYSVADTNNQLNVSGNWSVSNKSTNISIPSGGGEVLLYTGTYTQSVSSGNTYTASFSATLSGVEYQYNRSVSATGSNSITIPTPPITVPGTPVVTATPLSASVQVGYSTPSNGGSTILRYEYKTNIDATVRTTPSNPFKIAGTPGTAITTYVRAVNSIGPGSYGSATATPYTTPPAPILSSQSGNGLITVTYSPTGTGGTTITSWQYSTNSGTNWTTLPSPVIQSGSALFNIAGSNGTPITVLVRAINAAGNGASSSITKTPATVPDAPTVILIPGLTDIQIKWTEPYNGGTTITGYTLKRTSPTNVNLLTNASAVYSYTDSGLTRNQSYTYTLSAVNAAGTGPITTISTTTVSGAGKIRKSDGTYISVNPKIYDGSNWITANVAINDGLGNWIYTK